MELKLRNAVQEDMDLLFKWANDPIVRQNAFNTTQIPYEDHVKWFDGMMKNDNVYQYILCDGNDDIGQIRLNIEGEKAVISYSVDARVRGRGLGREMVKLAADEVLNKITNVTQLVALVKHNNHASAKTFENCGFTKKLMEDYIEYTFDISRKSI